MTDLNVTDSVPIQNLAGVITEYHDHDTPLRRLHDLITYVTEKHASIRQTPPYSQLDLIKFGHRLHNRRHVADFLSVLYCGVFNKKLPTITKTVPARTSFPEKCVCGKTIYFRKRYDSDSMMSRVCQPCARIGLSRYEDGFYPEIGEEEPITYTTIVPRQTRAFRYISYRHTTEMIAAAEQIYRLLNPDP